MDFLELKYKYPDMPFTVYDGLCKANAMFSKYDSILLEDKPVSTMEMAVVTNICHQFDEGQIDYHRRPKQKYDLIIGYGRNGSSPYDSCAGNGKYRPIFWYEDEDVEWYFENMIAKE